MKLPEVPYADGIAVDVQNADQAHRVRRFLLDLFIHALYLQLGCE